jgi:uncharacterized protein (TIGR02246 family)
MMPMRRALAGFFFVLVIAAQMSGQNAVSPSDAPASTDVQGIGRVLDDFQKTWNVHDAMAFSMLFAEDADFTNIRGQGAHGREAVEKFHAERYLTIFKYSQLLIVETRIRFIKRDVAAVDARWEMTGARTLQGVDVGLRKGLLNYIMTKQGDTWMITVMHNVSPSFWANVAE